LVVGWQCWAAQQPTLQQSVACTAARATATAEKKEVEVSENGVFDLRTYQLKPGTGPEFHRIASEGVVPMLERYGIDVVAYGLSQVFDDRYFLLRSFASTAHRQEQLEAFYGSQEWLETFNDDIMSRIETYHVLVLPATALNRLGKHLVELS
jgi:NIPSNAP